MREVADRYNKQESLGMNQMISGWLGTMREVQRLSTIQRLVVYVSILVELTVHVF